MNVPLELIRMILDYAVEDYDRAQLLALRIVCSLFDQEVCSRISSPKFSSLYCICKPWVKIWRENCKETTSMLRWFRMAETWWKPNFYRSFSPLVFEGYLEDQKMSEADGAARYQQLSKCLYLCMYRRWYLGWVMESKKSPDKLSFIGGSMHDLECHLQGQSLETRRRGRLESDARFLETLLAIIKDDRKIVLESFVDSYVSPNDLNVCFGTTLLANTIAFGTCEMLKLLLYSIKRLPIGRLATYLDLTDIRGQEGRTFAKILLDHIFGFITNKTRFLSLLLRRTAGMGGKVFATVWEWFVATVNFPRRLVIVDRFGHEVTRRNLQPPPQDRAMRQSTTQTRLNLIASDCGRCLHAGCHFWKPKRQTRTMEDNPFHVAVSPLFSAIIYGFLGWADWYLWAGADPRHLKGDIALLQLAPNSGVREEVVTMLISWGWDPEKLEVDLDNIDQSWLHETCPWVAKSIKDGSWVRSDEFSAVPL